MGDSIALQTTIPSTAVPTTITVPGAAFPGSGTAIFTSAAGAANIASISVAIGSAAILNSPFQLFVPLTGTVNNAELSLPSVTAAVSNILEKPGQSNPENQPTSTAAASLQLWTIAVNATPGTVPATLADNLSGPWKILSGIIYYVPVPDSLPTSIDFIALSTALKAATTIVSASKSSTSSTMASSSTSSSTSSTASYSPSSTTTTDPISSTSQSPGSSSRSAQNGTIGESSNGSPVGGIVGGTIGGILGGLLLGAMIAWLIFRRKQRSRDSSPASPRWRETKADAFSPSTAATGTIAAANLSGWRKHLPQAKAENELAQEFNSIFVLIKIHVESFYSPSHGRATPGQISKLRSIVDSDIMRLLGSTAEIGTVLQRIIAGFLVARISLRSDPTESFLPASYLNVPSMIGVNLEDEKLSGRPSTGSKDLLPAFADWRVLTNFLTNNADARATENELKGRIDLASRLLSQALSGFEKRQQDTSNQDRSLRQIMNRIAAAGIDVFMQPSTFIFQWSDQRQSSRQNIVVYPAIVKILNESGKRLERVEKIVPAQKGQI